MDSMKDMKKKNENENYQRKKKEEAVRRILSNANGKRSIDIDGAVSNIEGTPGGSKRRRMNGEAIQTDKGLKAFGGSIEKTEAAHLAFKQKRLESGG